MVGLVQLLLKSNAASFLIEDYAACLESVSVESQIIENSNDDLGVLIMQVTPSYLCFWPKYFVHCPEGLCTSFSVLFCSFSLIISVVLLQILHIYFLNLILIPQ